MLLFLERPIFTDSQNRHYSHSVTDYYSFMVSYNINIDSLLAKQRRRSRPCTELQPRVFSLNSQSSTFEEYYDNIQGHLQLLSGMDELLAGSFLITAYTILTLLNRLF